MHKMSKISNFANFAAKIVLLCAARCGNFESVLHDHCAIPIRAIVRRKFLLHQSILRRVHRGKGILSKLQLASYYESPT